MDRLIKIIRSKAFIIAAACVVIYTLAGFFLVPYLVRHYVPIIAHNQLQKQATVGTVRTNPFVFTFEVNDFDLREPDGAPIAGFKRLFVDFELKSLFKWAWIFRQVALDGPSINAVIDRDGGLNLAQLVPPAPPDQVPPADEAPSALPRVIVEQIQLNQGRFTVSDHRQSPAALVALAPLDLQARNLTTLSGQTGEKTFTATLSDGATLQWKGTVGLNPLTLKGNLALASIKTATLWAFVKDTLAIEKPTGQIGLTVDCAVDQTGPETLVTLDNLTLALTDIGFALQGGQTPMLALPSVQISGGRFDLAERKAQIGALAIKGGRADLVMGGDGRLNWQRIVKPTTATAPTTGAPTATKTTQKPWRIDLSAFDLSGFAVGFNDTRRTPGMGAEIGALTVGLKAEAQVGDVIQARVGDIAVDVSGVALKALPAAEPLAQVNAIRLSGGDFDLGAKRLVVEKIAVEGGQVDLRREADGRLNLVDLLAPSANEAASDAQKPAPAAPKAESPSFAFLIKAFGLSGLQAAFSDQTVKAKQPLIQLDDLRLALSTVDGRSPMPFEMGATVRQGGTIAVSGTLDPSGPSVTSQVQVAALALPMFQPYIAPAVAAVLKSGTFSTHGKFQHGIKASAARTGYQGAFTLDALRIDSVAGDETLVGCKSLRAEQLTVNLAPDKIEIGQIRISEPSAKIVIEKDMSLNLANLVKKSAKPELDKKPKSPESGAGMPYLVKRVLIGQGRMDFADLSLPLPFGTKIHELKGNVVGISSAKGARAQVKLAGRVDDYGTARIDGELNTADPTAFLDIGVVFKNVEMTNLTPYSGKFAGRKIDSGKLSVDLQYKIDNQQLAGDNQIVVDRLSLGEKVKSPDAVNLPLDLALALLKDANGVIELGLPVKGSLDSPEFSFGGLIGKAIVNLLTKIVTSPFRALAALIPGGDEDKFKSIAFEPGRANIPPPEKEKLVNLAAAMQKRPQLKLVVQGGYHTESDGERLRRHAVRRKLAERMAEEKTGAAGEAEMPVDFSGSETTRALEALYAERLGAEALESVKDEIKAAAVQSAEKGGQAPAEDPGQLAKRLFGQLAEVEPLPETALVQLADQRAQAIIADLEGALAAERLGVTPSKASGGSDSPKAMLTLEALPAKK